MRQHIDLMSNLRIVNGTFKRCFLMILTFLCLNGEKVCGDSTYFPEDTEASNEATERGTVESAAIKEWANLQPSKKKTEGMTPPKNAEKKNLSLSEPQAAAPAPVVPASPVAPAPLVAPPPPVAPAPLVVPPAPVAPAAPRAEAPSKEPQPLKLTTVEPRAKAAPVHEAAPAQNVAKTTTLSYTDAANDRVPLAILEQGQEVHNQKWYLYSAAIRGLKKPSDTLKVVSMEGSPPNRGEEIQTLLVEMGVEAEKIRLIHGTGEEHQKGMTYIFSGDK